MTDTAIPSNAFAYQAQTLQGQPVAGTIDAADVEQAQRLLAGLRLRVLQIEPAKESTRGRPLKADDFAAFNLQLAHLTAAGMPVEHGLRLIAQDMRRGRLKTTINQLSAELEKGTPLEQAFENYKDRFPPLYSKLVAAGVRSGDLPGVLLNLGRHMDLVQRLRAAIWRASTYPLMVLAGLALVITFLSLVVIPQFQLMFRDFGVQLPIMTRALLSVPNWMPYVLLAAAIILVALVIAVQMIRRSRSAAAVTDALVLPMPLIGPVLRWNLVARWCDALKLGVLAGMDLPRSIELAGDVVGSPALRRDGDEISGALQAGKPIDAVEHTRLLPATVVAAMAMSSNNHDLPAAMTMLSDMYQQQSEARLTLIPSLLAPVLIIVVAVVIGFVIAGLFLPFINLLHAITS
jgi:type II secretory pathway component PulF